MMAQPSEKLIATCFSTFFSTGFDIGIISSAIVSRANGEFSWLDVGGIRSRVGFAIVARTGHLETGGLSHLFDMFRTFLSVGV